MIWKILTVWKLDKPYYYTKKVINMQSDRNKPHVDNTVCPYCQTTIRLGENTVVCSCCKMPHHLECWIENGRCTTYGCKGHRMPNPGMLAHRKQQLPIIDITFDEQQETSGWRRLKGHGWKVAIFASILLVSGYYLYRFL